MSMDYSTQVCMNTSCRLPRKYYVVSLYNSYFCFIRILKESVKSFKVPSLRCEFYKI